MKNAVLKNFSVFIIIELLLVVGLMVLNNSYFKMYHPSVYNPAQALMLVFFVGICTLIHGVLLYLSTQSPKQFIPYFMGSMGLKLFATFGFMILYVLLHKTQAKSFLINCTMGYFAFTMAHVVLILIAVNSKTTTITK